jgi:hypothetical protein
MSTFASPPDFQAFEQAALGQGFDEVLVRDWAPLQVVAPHTHDFGAQALMVAGELWLTLDGRTLHLRAGDRFELEPGVLHEERYGPQGATYWVARRQPRV